VPVQVQSFEWGTFYRDIKSGNYDLALMKWVGVIDPDQYNIAFHSNEFPPGRNRGYYSNTKVDSLLDEARSIVDTEKRLDYYKKIQTLIYKELAILPLWHENQIHIVHPRIENYKVNAMGDFMPLVDITVKKEI
jgi:peptide/nickel transport system substrate-binding protein